MSNFAIHNRIIALEVNQQDKVLNKKNKSVFSPAAIRSLQETFISLKFGYKLCDSFYLICYFLKHNINNNLCKYGVICAWNI